VAVATAEVTVLVAVETTGATALVAVGWAVVVDAGGAVTAETTGATADVAAGTTELAVPELFDGSAGDRAAASAGLAGVVADVAVDVTVDVGKLAACACRENDSKTARMPTAKMATCTARRAMRRNTGWGTSRSRPVGTDLTQGCQDRRDPGSHNLRLETTVRWKLFTTRWARSPGRGASGCPASPGGHRGRRAAAQRVHRPRLPHGARRRSYRDHRRGLPAADPRPPRRYFRGRMTTTGQWAWWTQ